MNIIVGFNFKYFLRKKTQEFQNVTAFNLVFFLDFKK